MTGGGTSVGGDDLVLEAKLQEGFPLLLRSFYRRIAAVEARKQGLAAGEEELDEVCSRFLSERGLMEEAEVDAWMEWLAVKEPELDAYFEEIVLEGKLRVKVVPDSEVEKRFRESQYDYAKVETGFIEIQTSGAAREIMVSLREREITWEKVLSDFRGVGSDVIQRRHAPEEAAALLFSAEIQEYVGPIEMDDGAFRIYRVLAREVPKLDGELRTEIRLELFRAFLERLLAKDPIRFKSDA